MKPKIPVTPIPTAREPWPPLAIFIFKTALGTLAGGLLFALLAFYFQKGYLGMGLLLGVFLSVLYLLSLKNFSAKVLESGNQKNRKTFWMRQALRWLVFALVCWILLRVSNLCLVGAVLSFTWFIAVLAWVGWAQGKEEMLNSKNQPGKPGPARSRPPEPEEEKTSFI